MAQSFQKEKPPARINLFLEVLKGDAKAKLELPQRSLVMGDFTGRADDTPLEDREVINVNKDNFESIMKSLDLKIEAVVKNRLKAGDDEMKVGLKINGMNSFRPEEIARQVPELNRLLAMRNLLQDLRNRVVTMAQFRKELERVVKDKDSLARLSGELDRLITKEAEDGAANADTPT